MGIGWPRRGPVWVSVQAVNYYDANSLARLTWHDGPPGYSFARVDHHLVYLKHEASQEIVVGVLRDVGWQCLSIAKVNAWEAALATVPVSFGNDLEAWIYHAATIRRMGV